MRSFPFEFALRREARFYPEDPGGVTGDVLEIGPGRGDFLLAKAQSYPNRRFVAIELKKRRFRKLVDRVKRRELANVLLINGDARIVVRQSVPPNAFSQIYVLFPDPWPKRRHEPMRLLNDEFLELLAARLTSGGELILATDDQSYRGWIMKHADRVDDLRLGAVHESGDALTPEWVPTLFEQKWRDEGRTITYFSYIRPAED
ncbi:MAG: hypothetical protein GF341_03395 [candidate division Zixibacteria bacterium]|nr:hypothetical protein [candidate division Zixibacteria bacterium]